MIDIIKNSIIYPFEDKDWIKKYGISALIIAALGIFSTIIQLVFVLPAQMTSGILEGFSNSQYAASSMSSIASLTASMFSWAASIVSIPVTLYFVGYFFEFVKEYVSTKKINVPYHGDILNRLGKGVVLYVINTILSIPVGILAFCITLLFVLLFTITSTLGQVQIVQIALFIILGLLAFAVLIGIIVLSIFIYISSYYIYVTTEDFGQSLNPKRIFNLIKKYWKKYIMTTVYQIVISILSMVAAFITLFITMPVIYTSIYYSSAYIYAQLFSEMKEN